jgi:hypothetical protein
VLPQRSFLTLAAANEDSGREESGDDALKR